MRRPRVTVLYHFFYPDDVVSARHFSDLAEGLAERGWEVTARPSNRACRNGSAAFPRRERWGEVTIRRVWRPPLRQAAHVGRLVNAAWMLGAWTLAALTSRRRGPEVVILGTDPILSPLAVLPWTMLRRRTNAAHWCFDLYPDAAIADGLLRDDSFAVRFLQRLLGAAYRRCELVADLGSCMAARLEAHGLRNGSVTLTPWALVEPAGPVAPDPAVRRELFGDARLALLYSGTFGRAHSFELFLELARRLRDRGVHFCFAGRGNRVEELRQAIRPEDQNVTIASFAPEAELEKRLTACDLHLVSLREEWTGTVVPSKFFGALAAGRGVVFAGGAESSIAQWIREEELGWVLTADALPDVARRLAALADDPGRVESMRLHCHRTYQRRFSKQVVIDRWDAELRRLVGEEHGPASGERAACATSCAAPNTPSGEM